MSFSKSPGVMFVRSGDGIMEAIVWASMFTRTSLDVAVRCRGENVAKSDQWCAQTNVADTRTYVAF